MPIGGHFGKNRIHFVHDPVPCAGCLRARGEPMTPCAAAIADSVPRRPSHGHGPRGHPSIDRRIVSPPSLATRWRGRARRVRRSIERHPMLLMLGILHIFLASICDAYSTWGGSPRPLRRYHANSSNRSSRRRSSALAALDRTTTTPPPTNIPLSPSTFAGQVEKELLNRFEETKIERVLQSWRLLELDYSHREFVGSHQSPPIQESEADTSRCYQLAPYYVPGLLAKTWWDDVDRLPWAKSLAKAYPSIRDEFSSVISNPDKLSSEGNNIWARALSADAESYGVRVTACSKIRFTDLSSTVYRQTTGRMEHTGATQQRSMG